MNIPLIENLGPDGVIIGGMHKGEEHYYKSALFNTLLALRPKVCLEIGTYHGGSARIFERYFTEYEPGGVLVTVDIRLYSRLELEHVVQVKWYPHTGRYWSLRNYSDDELLPNGAGRYHESEESNTRLLRDELHRLHKTAFEFAYIDGDHRRISVEKDLAICKTLTVAPHHILMDDVIEGIHESSKFYQDMVSKEWAHYDFDDWYSEHGILSGTALIWQETPLPQT